MIRIRPLTEEDVPLESRSHFQRDRATFGTALNSTRIYAHCPPILSAAKALGTAIEQSGRLLRQLRCLIIYQGGIPGGLSLLTGHQR